MTGATASSILLIYGRRVMDGRTFLLCVSLVFSLIRNAGVHQTMWACIEKREANRGGHKEKGWLHLQKYGATTGGYGVARVHLQYNMAAQCGFVRLVDEMRGSNCNCGIEGWKWR